jgi:PTH2 family peptidyl-tRNA hydrolase
MAKKKKRRERRRNFEHRDWKKQHGAAFLIIPPSVLYSSSSRTLPVLIMGILDWAKKIKSSAIKQVIVVRSDLNLGKGKLAGQVAHASVAGYRKSKREQPEMAEKWEEEGEKKVVVKITGEKELMLLFQEMKDAGIPVSVIRDAGLTQIEPGTTTCFAAGPYLEAELDKYTKQLKLL